MTTAVRPRPATATRHRQHISATIHGRLHLRDDDLDLDIYDIVAMERALNGDPTPLNEAEQYEVAHQLHAYYDAGREITGTGAEGKRVGGQKEIARRVGVSDRTINRWNKSGWPDRTAHPDGTLQPASKPNAADTAEERWATYTQPDSDGHLIWTGPTAKRGVPVFALKYVIHQGNRIAFQMHNGREPQHFARPGCGVELCVEPSHMIESARRSSPRQPGQPTGRPSTPEAVADLVAKGLTDRRIAAELTIARQTVMRIRKTLGLPAAKATLEQAFHAYTSATDGGHLTWTGPRSINGTAILTHDGRPRSARRVAFRIHTGREPVGRVQPECGVGDCIAPAHVEDVPGRIRSRAALRAVALGLPARTGNCRNGHDQAEHGRIETDGRAYCAICQRGAKARQRARRVGAAA